MISTSKFVNNYFLNTNSVIHRTILSYIIEVDNIFVSNKQYIVNNAYANNYLFFFELYILDGMFPVFTHINCIFDECHTLTFSSRGAKSYILKKHSKYYFINIIIDCINQNNIQKLKYIFNKTHNQDLVRSIICLFNVLTLIKKNNLKMIYFLLKHFRININRHMISCIIRTNINGSNIKLIKRIIKLSNNSDILLSELQFASTNRMFDLVTLLVEQYGLCPPDNY
jgi:hypothetical protein